MIVGSVSDTSQTHRVASYLERVIAERDDLELRRFDAGDTGMKITDKARNPVQDYTDKVNWADGFIIVSPEYNHSFSGPLKMTLDLLLPEYYYKPVGMVGVSAGMLGGARMIESLAQVVRELGMPVSRVDLTFARVKEAFDDDGEPKDEKMPERIIKFMNELLFLTKSMMWGRANLK